jgi:hypothetical protein
VFLGSFVDFDGLTAGEIDARLFTWWFGPGFLALLVAAPGSSSYLYVSSAAIFIGMVLTGLVVLRDAKRASVARPWLWVFVTAFVPLIGWWLYGRARAPDHTIGIPEYRGRPSALARLVNPFWQVRLELRTHLSREECAARLNELRVNWTSPRQWFSPERERPLQGSVSSRGFSVRWRHSMTRPGLLTEASSRFETRGAATIVHLRLGQSVWDRFFVLLWLAIAAVVGVPLAVTNPPGVPGGFHLFWLAGWLGFFLLLHLGIRTISRDDDLRLRRLIIQVLEAEEMSPTN